jgi:hypothetical protein
MKWVKSREELEELIERREYVRLLWHSKSVWNKLEALYFLELEGYAFTNEVLCEVLRELGETACREK